MIQLTKVILTLQCTQIFLKLKVANCLSQRMEDYVEFVFQDSMLSHTTQLSLLYLFVLFKNVFTFEHITNLF